MAKTCQSQEEEYIFFTNDVDSYLDLESSWDAPNRITNGIIDIDPNIKNDFSNLWKMLEDVHCEYIQIRIYQSISLTLLRTILSSISNRRIISIELLIKDNFEYGRDELLSLISDYPRILYLWLHSSRKNECVYTPNKDSEFGYIIRSKEKYDNSGCCGNVSASNFDLSYKLFSESQLYNSCLNRKISIDTEGNIKNCPSMPESYGNIRDTTLAEAIEKPGFKKFWNINKDKIHVCKDCEFRYICTDCRAYIEDHEDVLSKPLKCGYNPYTGEWSEWSTNPLKQKAIEFYGMREMVEEMNKPLAKELYQNDGSGDRIL